MTSPYINITRHRHTLKHRLLAGMVGVGGRQWRYLGLTVVGMRATSRWIRTKPGLLFWSLTKSQQLSILSTATCAINKVGHEAVRHLKTWTFTVIRMQLQSSLHSRMLLRTLLFSSAVGVQHLLNSGPARVFCKGRVGVTSARLLPVERVQDQQLQFNWRKLGELLSPDLLLLILAVLAALVVAALNIRIPLELGQLVNTVAQLQPGHKLTTYVSQLLYPGVRLACLYSVQSIFTFGYICLLSLAGERLAGRLRNALFQALVQQDIDFFDQHRTGELISRLSGDVQDFKSSFKLVVSQGLRSLTQILGCVASLYLISPQMTALVGATLPIMIAIGSAFGAVLRRWSRQAQEQVAMATGVADEALSNIRTVRAFAMEDKESNLYGVELQQAQWLSERLGTGIALFQALSNLAINGIVLGVVSHGGLLLATNQITAGDLMSFLVATQTIQRSLGTMSVLFGQVVKGVAAGSRVFEYMELHPSVPLVGGTRIPVSEIEGRIEFRNVKFSYPGRPEQVVLDGLTLELPAGRVTALCGLSGAGKSTVAALLERFYEPQGGNVLLDGCSLSSLDPSWLRGQVLGFISQEPVLFATTIRENIRYGRPNATDAEVCEAAKLANAHNFIYQFPRGYDTLVGERGVALSGGQKQRVAIARALLKNPRVLILDEATSALDCQAERLVQEALDKACRGRTVLVIAHRLSTVQDADRIAVLHKGRLRELGTHAELLAQKGVYAELIRRQSVDGSS